MAEFSITSEFANVGDILRNYNFELIIPQIDDVTSDDLRIRVRNAVLPGRSNEPIESNFMGMKQIFSGRATFTNTLPILFEEFEDRKISKALYSWQQKIFDTKVAGAALAEDKKEITETIILRLLKYNGDEVETNGKIYFRGAWPQNVEDVTLDYTSNESIKYSCTFQFDTWDYGN